MEGAKIAFFDCGVAMPKSVFRSWLMSMYTCDLDLGYDFGATIDAHAHKHVCRMNKLFVAAPRNEDANALKHVAGSVSIRKGGGEFEFTIAPGPSQELDEENIVIGQV